MKHTSIVLGTVCLALVAARPPTSDDETFTLSHKAHKKWDFFLPAERWAPVGAELELPGGLLFATETVGPLKLRVDTNGDGRVDKDVKGQTGGFLTLRGKTEAGEKVHYSARFRNVAAGKWEWATGSSRSGLVDGVMVHVFDQDGNGRFDDYGVDAVAFGADKYASLLSRVVSMDGELLEFDVDTDGQSVRVRPFEGPTGVLNAEGGFDSKGKLKSAVFRNRDLSFQIAGNKRGVEVPAGRYEFVSGRVEKGSSSASIRRGRMRSFEVAEGDVVEFDWGEDLVGEFSFSQKGDEVRVNADFGFFGAGGEEYYDFQPRGKGPKISIEDQKRGRSLKEGRFPES